MDAASACCPGKNCIRSIIFIERFKNNYFIAWVDKGQHRGNHALGGAAGDGYFSLRIGRDSDIASILFSDRVAKRFVAPGNGVLVDVGLGVLVGVSVAVGARATGTPRTSPKVVTNAEAAVTQPFEPSGRAI